LSTQATSIETDWDSDASPSALESERSNLSFDCLLSENKRHRRIPREISRDLIFNQSMCYRTGSIQIACPRCFNGTSNMLSELNRAALRSPHVFALELDRYLNRYARYSFFPLCRNASGIFSDLGS